MAAQYAAACQEGPLPHRTYGKAGPMRGAGAIVYAQLRWHISVFVAACCVNGGRVPRQGRRAVATAAKEVSGQRAGRAGLGVCWPPVASLLWLDRACFLAVKNIG